MKSIKPFIVLAITCCQSLIASSQPKALLSYFPANPKMIIKVDPLRLALKIKWQELTQLKMFQDLMKDAQPGGKDFLGNPANTGIRIDQGIFLCMPQQTGTEKAAPILYAIPRDTAQVAAALKKLFPGKRAAKVGNGRVLIDNHTAIAWNNEIVLLTTDAHGKDSTTNKNPAAEATRLKKLSDKCKALLTKKPNAFDKPEFISLMSEKGDLLFWSNGSASSRVGKNSKLPPGFDMLGKNLMRQRQFTTTVVNFEKGKIEARMKQYQSISLDSLYQKYPLKNINTEMLRKLPAGRPILLLSFNLSPAMLTDMLSQMKEQKPGDSSGKMNVMIESALRAIDGDLTMAVIKPDETEQVDSVTRSMGGIEIFVAGGIGNRDDFRQLDSILSKPAHDSTKSQSSKKSRPMLMSNDSIFILSFSKTVGEKFLAAPPADNEMERMFEPYSRYPFALVLDLKTIFGFAMQSMLKQKSEDEAKQANDVLGMFDQIIGYGGQHDDHSVTSTMQLTLTNKDENSLTQFIKLINLVYSFKSKKSVAINKGE